MSADQGVGLLTVAPYSTSQLIAGMGELDLPDFDDEEESAAETAKSAVAKNAPLEEAEAAAAARTGHVEEITGGGESSGAATGGQREPEPKPDELVADSAGGSLLLGVAPSADDVKRRRWPFRSPRF